MDQDKNSVHCEVSKIISPKKYLRAHPSMTATSLQKISVDVGVCTKQALVLRWVLFGNFQNSQTGFSEKNTFKTSQC
jgi:hypothetical protein